MIQQRCLVLSLLLAMALSYFGLTFIIRSDQSIRATEARGSVMPAQPNPIFLGPSPGYRRGELTEVDLRRRGVTILHDWFDLKDLAAVRPIDALLIDVTDANGEATFDLPQGDYRFRSDLNGTQFWSGEANDCAIAGCTSVLMTIPDPVLVVVQDTSGTPMEGLPVYVFDGATYNGKHGSTDANREVSLRLVEGDNRFRADFNGTQFCNV
jgi:hypothetical protein